MYTELRSNGVSADEALDRARESKGNLGYIYASYMVLPMKVIIIGMVLFTSAVEPYASMFGVEKIPYIFTPAWIWWTISGYFAWKINHWVGWAIYVTIHALVMLLVLPSMLS